MLNVSPYTLQSLEEDYQYDESFRELFENPIEPYTKTGKRLYSEQRLCIPKGELRKTILQSNDESLVGSHKESNKTDSLKM